MIKVDIAIDGSDWLHPSTLDRDTLEQILDADGKQKEIKKSNDLPELMTLLAAAEYLFKQGESSEEWVTGFVPPEKRHYHPEGKHKGPREGRFSIIGTEVDQEGNPLTSDVQAQAPDVGSHIDKLRKLHPDLNEEDIERVAAFARGVAAYNSVEDRVSGISGNNINHEEFVNGQNVGIGPAQEGLLDADGMDEGMEFLTVGALLEAHEGTPWARAAQRAIKIREDLSTLLEGKEPEGEPGEIFSAKKLIPMLREKGAEGIWEYLEGSGLIGGASKPAGAIGSSALNCAPSHDCAKFCYAYKGTGQITSVVVKSELIEWAAANDPERFAKQIVKEYQTGKDGKRLYQAGRALRFFDRGEGSEYWAKIINGVNQIPTENGHPVRIHIFSKRPSFLDMVDEQNVRLLSIDPSNPDLARGNNLPIAFVYTGKQDLPLLEEFKDRIQVILPVKDAKTGATDEDIQAARDLGWTKPYVCPIDSGDKVISKAFDPKPKPVQAKNKDTGEMESKQSWTCANCDVGKGIGCYRDQPTDYSTFKPQPIDFSDVSNKELTELTVLQEDANTFQQFLSVDEVKDMVRGVGHIYRRDLSEEQQQAAAESSGVREGQWKAENEDKFTESLLEELLRGHENVGTEGSAGVDEDEESAWTGTLEDFMADEDISGRTAYNPLPPPDVEKAMDSPSKSPFRKWLRGVYLSIKDGPGGKDINPKLAQILEGPIPVQKSDDLPELLTLLTAVEYMAKQDESEWARFEDWTWKIPETQKYRHDGGKHVGPHGGKYDVIGYEITADGDPIGPGMVTGAGVPRATRVPVQPQEKLDFKDPSGLKMVPIEEFAKGLEEISSDELKEQVRQAYVSGLGANDLNDTPLQPNVAVYAEVENKDTGKVEKRLSGVTTGDGHWIQVGGNTNIQINTNPNGKIQATHVAPNGSPASKYSWAWSANSGRKKFAKIEELIKSGVMDIAAQRAIKDISNPQRFTLKDTADENFDAIRALAPNTIQRSAMVAALIFHTARRPGGVGSKSNISVPDGDKLMTGGGKVSTAKGLAALRKVKPGVSIVKNDILAPVIRGEGKNAAVSQFSVRTFGVSTLQQRHIVPQSDGSVMLSFIGKSAKVNHASVTDPVLAKKLTQMSKDKKLGDEDYLFSSKAWGGTGTTPLGDVNPYIRGITVDAFPDIKMTAKDFRTLHANVAAAKLIGEADIPTTKVIGDRNVSTLNQQDFMESVEAAVVQQVLADTAKLRKEGIESPLTSAEIQNISRLWIQRRQDGAKLDLAEEPSGILGNDPGTCLGNYINPDLFDEWNQYNELETDELMSNITSMPTRKFNSIAKKLKELKGKGWKITAGAVTHTPKKKKKK